jgi:hypothetical protein
MRGGARTGAGRKPGTPNKVQKEKSVIYQIRVSAALKTALRAIGSQRVREKLEELFSPDAK